MKTEAETAIREALEKRQLLQKLQKELQELENEEHIYKEQKSRDYFQKLEYSKYQEKKQRKKQNQNKGYLGLKAMKLYGKQPSDSYAYKAKDNELSSDSQFVQMGKPDYKGDLLKNTNFANSKKRTLLRK